MKRPEYDPNAITRTLIATPYHRKWCEIELARILAKGDTHARIVEEGDFIWITRAPSERTEQTNKTQETDNA